MQIPLGRAEVLVAREFLRHNGIAGVLRRSRAEFVAQCVPHEPLVAAPFQTGELEELAPHATEVLLASSVLGPEDVRVWIVFVKRYTSATRFVRYQHEQAYVLAKGRPANPRDPIGDVLTWEYSGNQLHPSQKPVSVFAPLVRAFSEPGELVLDPFCGSGSSVVAARNLRRAYVGIELTRRYYEIASERLRLVSADKGRLTALADGCQSFTPSTTPVDHASLIWNDLSSQLDLRTISKAASKAVEAAIATVDHSDIRGSVPHNRDPSGATSD